MIARFFRLLKLKRELSRGYARQKIVREARAEAARGGTDDETQHTERTKGQHGIGTGRMDRNDIREPSLRQHEQDMERGSKALLEAIRCWYPHLVPFPERQ